MVDPYCFHEKQCSDGINVTFQRYEDEEEMQKWKKAKWTSEHLHEDYSEMLDELEDDSCVEDEDGAYQCCCAVVPCEVGTNAVPECRNHPGPYLRYHYRYSIMLFEKSNGHGTEYFAKRFKWTEEERQLVDSVKPSHRYACLACRQEYAIQLVLAEAPVPESDVDILHGDVSFRHGSWFSPSFYGAGAFNSERVGENARSLFEMLSVLHAQCISEKARYIQRHNTDEGFVDRFVYNIELPKLFKDASSRIFPPSGRAPVGLNPERFVGVCEKEKCGAFLVEREFGTKFCENCSCVGA